LNGYGKTRIFEIQKARPGQAAVTAAQLQVVEARRSCRPGARSSLVAAVLGLLVAMVLLV